MHRRDQDRRTQLDPLSRGGDIAQRLQRLDRIERAESSPTAVVLGKLAAAFQVSVSALLTPAPATGVHRIADATEWHDPATGYRRRQITGPRFPADIAEIHLPPGARVPYPAASLAFQRAAVWVLDGHLTFHEGDTVHELNPGDSIEVNEPVPHLYANTTDADCRYAIILTRVERP